MKRATDIRIASITRRGAAGVLLRIIGPAVDRVFGLRKLRRLYEGRGFAGLDKLAFIDRFEEALKIRYSLDPGLAETVPASGPVVILANHPLGGLEGILLARLLSRVRDDYKIFANVMLSFIEELKDFFIFTNPVLKGGRQNYDSISQAARWLRDGHLLLVFPAGRVGIYRPEKGYVTDEPWDLIALSLGLKAEAVFIPLFVGGECSRGFSLLSRFVYPMKLLMLVREFLSSFSKEVSFRPGRPVGRARLAAMGKRHANAYLRMRVYLLAPLRGPEPTPRSPPGDAPSDQEGIPVAVGVAGSARCRLVKNDGGWELSGLFRGAGEEGSAARSLWLELEAYRPLSGSIPLVDAEGEAYLPASRELIAALLCRRALPERLARKRRKSGRLHPEVLGYLDRFGMGEGELGEVIQALEGKKRSLPFLLAEAWRAGARFSPDPRDPASLRFEL